jgi:hypothetical protein
MNIPADWLNLFKHALSSITFEVIAAMFKRADIEMAGVERVIRGER